MYMLILICRHRNRLNGWPRDYSENAQRGPERLAREVRTERQAKGRKGQTKRSALREKEEGGPNHRTSFSDSPEHKNLHARRTQLREQTIKRTKAKKGRRRGVEGGGGLKGERVGKGGEG